MARQHYRWSYQLNTPVLVYTIDDSGALIVEPNQYVAFRYRLKARRVKPPVFRFSKIEDPTSWDVGLPAPWSIPRLDFTPDLWGAC